MRNIILIFLLGLMASTFAQSKEVIKQAAKEVVIATMVHKSPRLIVSKSIMRQIYRRLGYTMTIVSYPAKRSLVEVSKGFADGELARGSIIETEFPNLIRIPYAVGNTKLVAIQMKTDPPIQQLTDLKGHHVGLLRGILNSKNISQNLSQEFFNEVPGLFKAMMKGRIDTILFSKLGAETYIRNHNLADKVVVAELELMNTPIYHYLNQDAKNMAAALKKEMQSMQATGELQDLIKSQELHFLNTKPHAKF